MQGGNDRRQEHDYDERGDDNQEDSAHACTIVALRAWSRTGGAYLGQIRPCLGSSPRGRAVHDLGDNAECRAWPAPHATPAPQDGAGREGGDPSGVARLVQIDETQRQFGEPQHLPARLAEEHEVLAAEPGRHRHNTRTIDQLGVVGARLEPGRGDAGPQPQTLDIVTDPGPLLVRRYRRGPGKRLRRRRRCGRCAGADGQDVRRQGSGQRPARRRGSATRWPQSSMPRFRLVRVLWRGVHPRALRLTRACCSVAAASQLRAPGTPAGRDLIVCSP